MAYGRFDITYCQLVTEVDQAVEAFISKTISEKYPSHKLYVAPVIRRRSTTANTPSTSIGEETYAAEGKMDLTDEFTWIVDPIDGEMSETAW
jgi:myo-inositol-1(or 4)-monophosphatase